MAYAIGIFFINKTLNLIVKQSIIFLIITLCDNMEIKVVDWSEYEKTKLEIRF